MIDWITMSRSSQNLTPETSDQTQSDWASATKNAFHSAITDVMSSQDKNGYLYPRELEFLRDTLSSDKVKEQIAQFIRQEASYFLEVFKERKEKSAKNPNKQHKPVKYLIWTLSLALPFDEDIHTKISPNYRGRIVSMALLSLYPELDEFFAKTQVPYTHLRIRDASDSFGLEKKNNEWIKESSRDDTKERYSPGFMEFEVSTRKMITAEDIAFVESQLASQQK